MQDLAPVTELTVPSSHGWQFLWPGGRYFPTGQGSEIRQVDWFSDSNMLLIDDIYLDSHAVT